MRHTDSKQLKGFVYTFFFVIVQSSFEISQDRAYITLRIQVLQESLNNLHSWSTKNGISFSPTKSVGVHFCRQHSCNHNLQLKIGSGTLPTATVATYLGMLLYEKLSWLKQSSTQKLYIIRKLAHPWLRYIYTNLIVQNNSSI